MMTTLKPLSLSCPHITSQTVPIFVRKDDFLPQMTTQMPIHGVLPVLLRTWRVGDPNAELSHDCNNCLVLENVSVYFI